MFSLQVLSIIIINRLTTLQIQHSHTSTQITTEAIIQKVINHVPISRISHMNTTEMGVIEIMEGKMTEMIEGREDLIGIDMSKMTGIGITMLDMTLIIETQDVEFTNIKNKYFYAQPIFK